MLKLSDADEEAIYQLGKKYGNCRIRYLPKDRKEEMFAECRAMWPEGMGMVEELVGGGDD